MVNLNEVADKDQKNVVTIQLDNNKLYIKQEPVYGFWSVNFDKGQVPRSLQSQFTTLRQARTAVDHYLTLKKREKVKED